MSTAAIAFWLTVALTVLALGPAAWTLGRESWRRQRAARAGKRLEAAAQVIDASPDEALEPLMASLRAKFDAATIERAIVLQLRRDDEVTRARGARLFSALGLDVTFGLRLQKGVKWSERTHAAEVLGLAGQSSAVPALVAALRDRYEDDASVKIAAAAALARLKDPTAIPLLIAELKSTDERSLRNVAEALVAFGPLAVPALLDLLVDATQAGARVWAAQILGKIGDARATDELVTRLYDRDDRLRMAAAEALGEIGDARALQPIVRATLRDPAPHVRAHAAGALARLEGERAVDVLVAALADPDYATRLRALEAFETIRVEDTAPLESALRDANPEVRRRAALALERVGHLEKLIARLSAPSRATREQAYAGILELGRVGLTDSVVAYVNHPSFEVRAVAARAAGELGVARVAPLLISAIADEMWPVRAAVAEALGQLRADGSVEKLVKLLRDAEEPVREAAVEALAAFPPAELEPHAQSIVQTYDEGSVAQRTQAVVILARVPGTTSDELLVRATVDPSDAVRLRAVSALGARGGAVMVSPLVARLTDASLEVRMAAVAAFGSEATTEAFEGLLRALAGSSTEMRDRIADTVARGARAQLFARMGELERTASTEVKIGIAWTLGKVGEAAGVPTLTRFLRERDARLRASAAGALAKIVGRETVTALVRAVDDPDEHVRAAIVNALARNPTDPRVLPLLEMRMRDPDAFVRNRALVALARVGGAAMEASVVALATSVSPEALWVALALVGTETALTRVLEALADPNDAGLVERVFGFVAREHPEVRSTFFQMLKLDDPADAPDRLPGTDVVPLIERYEALLRTSLDVETRRLAVKALGRMSQARAIETTADALIADPDESVRKQAAESLRARTYDPRARRALARAVADPSAEVASRAARALAGLRDPEIVDALTRRLGTGAPEVQQTVEEVLADRYRDEPDPFLDWMMGHDVPELLVPGIRVLARIASRDTLPLLSYLASSKSALVRAAAVRALAALTLPEATRVIDGLLLDPSDDVRLAVLDVSMWRSDAVLRTSGLRRDPSVRIRVAAAVALERSAARAPMGGAMIGATVEALAGLLDDGAAEVRAAALASLIALDGGVGLRRFVKAWSQSTLDTQIALRADTRAAAISAQLAHGLGTLADPIDRQATVTALGALGANGYAAHVLPALRDPAAVVRVAAVRALATLDDAEVRKRLEEMLKDPDREVQDAVRRARIATVG